MKTIITYVCEICDGIYNTPELAQACEQSSPPPKRCQVGQEIKLSNRNTGHTLAVVAGMRLVQSYPARNLRASKPSEWHQWEIELDREVCLDHHWEEGSNLIPDHYIIDEIDPKAKIRDDNNCY